MANTWSIKWTVAILFTIGSVVHWANAASAPNPAELAKPQGLAQHSAMDLIISGERPGRPKSLELQDSSRQGSNVETGPLKGYTQEIILRGLEGHPDQTEDSSSSSDIQDSDEQEFGNSEEQTRTVRSPSSRFLGFHSELQDDFPFIHGHGFPASKMVARRKRRSGIVIRGPFYPYPKPGHPLRYASAAAPSVASPPWCRVILTLFVTMKSALVVLKTW